MQPWTVDIRAKRPNRPVSHQLHLSISLYHSLLLLSIESRKQTALNKQRSSPYRAAALLLYSEKFADVPVLQFPIIHGFLPGRLLPLFLRGCLGLLDQRRRRAVDLAQQIIHSFFVGYRPVIFCAPALFLRF